MLELYNNLTRRYHFDREPTAFTTYFGSSTFRPSFHRHLFLPAVFFFSSSIVAFIFVPIIVNIPVRSMVFYE